METIIQVENLMRVYDSTIGIIKRKKIKVNALNGISFEVKRGEIFGLLGPNGAGKTTTIKILTTLLAPTSGNAKVLGYKAFGDEKKLRPRINFIFGGERSLYWRLSGRDNLLYFADLYKVDKETRKKRIPELLQLVGLTDRADEKVESYSKGMKQRLQIARGLINDPEVIFLDEPTIGLDPVGARDLRKMITMLSDLGKTIMLTTHYMYEADELCDRIAIIDNGNIVALDTPQNLKKLAKGLAVLELKILGIDKMKVDEIKAVPGIATVTIKQEDQVQILQIQCEDPSFMTQKVMDILSENEVIGVNIREATLEDIYLKLVGGKL